MDIFNINAIYTYCIYCIYGSICSSYLLYYAELFRMNLFQSIIV